MILCLLIAAVKAEAEAKKRADDWQTAFNDKHEELEKVTVDAQTVYDESIVLRRDADHDLL